MTVYLVLDDFGPLGRAWREIDEAGTKRSTLVRNSLDGQHKNPVRVADEVRRRFIEYDDAPTSLLRLLKAANRH